MCPLIVPECSQQPLLQPACNSRPIWSSYHSFGRFIDAKFADAWPEVGNLPGRSKAETKSIVNKNTDKDL